MFVFPMAGLSSRFSKAGYTLPKHMLQAGAHSVFWHVLSGFSAYFETDAFLFICRDVQGTVSFVEAECRAMGIKSYQIVVLDEPTRGQAETVYLGLQKASVPDHEPITIYNIDTIHPDFHHPAADQLNKMDGYLEVFLGEGDAWSFARTVSDADMTVVETAEKRRISDYCSTGLYYFRQCAMFTNAYDEEVKKPQSEWLAKELYVAPLYNYMLRDGFRIEAVLVPKESMIPCGVPDEYVDFCKRFA